MARDYREARLAEADRAMLDYAVRLTRTPGAMGQSHVDRLREVGFDDTAILDICQVTAYYNVNRLADGLGVELEESWEADELTVTRDDLAARRARRSAGPGR